MDARPTDQAFINVVELIPTLRAYAWSLSRNGPDADDLVQETLVKAIANQSKFERGTNLRAWLFTIMRNTFFNSFHKRKREQTGSADCVSSSVSAPATQEWSMMGTEVMAIIAELPAQFREVLILVVMSGESYENAAVICNCAVGTIKSRVNRARQMVIDRLQAKVD